MNQSRGETKLKTNQKANRDNKSEKDSKKTIVIIVAAVIVIAAATLAALLIIGVFKPEPEPANGVIGQITDDWDPGVENPEPAKSGTQIPGYDSAEMKAGDASLKLSIGNPKENNVGFYASLVLEDGTVLYESTLLKPGQGLTEIPLSKTLDKGTYNAKVVYQCVALDENNTPLNAAESGFTLIVN